VPLSNKWSIINQSNHNMQKECLSPSLRSDLCSAHHIIPFGSLRPNPGISASSCEYCRTEQLCFSFTFSSFNLVCMPRTGQTANRAEPESDFETPGLLLRTASLFMYGRPPHISACLVPRTYVSVMNGMGFPRIAMLSKSRRGQFLQSDARKRESTTPRGGLSLVCFMFCPLCCLAL